MEMTNREMKEFLDYLDENGLEVTAEAFGMTIEEIRDIYPAMELLDSKDEDEIVSEWEPDYSKTAEYEGTGITSEFIPGEGLFAPVLEGLGVDPTTASMIGSVATRNPGKLANKLFASKNLKANQLKNRGVEGPVVKGASRTLKDSNLRPSIKNKAADRYKSMSDKVKKDRAVKGATVAGAGTILGLSGDDEDVVYGHPELAELMPKVQERGLTGNRDKDGSLKTTEPDYDVFDEEALDPPTGPDMPETMGNQYGYHKKQGQNFWTVNNDDPYWDTHVMGTGDAWSDADLKKEPAKELDWSSWFN